MRVAVVIAVCLLAASASAADDTLFTTYHDAQSGSGHIAQRSDTLIGCILYFDMSELTHMSARYLRAIDVSMYNSDTKSRMDSIFCAIYRRSDLARITYTSKVGLALAATTAGKVHCPVVDSVALNDLADYVVVAHAKSNYFQICYSDSTGDTTFTMSSAFASGAPATFTINGTRANVKAQIGVWVGTTSNGYGVAHNLSFLNSADDTITVKDSVRFIGLASNAHDTTVLYVKAVTSPPTKASLFGDPDTTLAFIDTLVSPNLYKVCSFKVQGMPENGFVAFGAVSCLDTIDTLDNVYHLRDTSSITTKQTGLNRPTMAVVCMDSLQYGTTYDGGMLQCANFDFADIPRLRVCEQLGYGARSVIRFNDLETALPDTAGQLGAYLTLRSATDDAKLWVGIARVRIQLLSEAIGECAHPGQITPMQDTGFPKWSKRAAGANWTDSGAGPGSRFNQYVEFNVDTSQGKEYTVDISHMVAWARFHGVGLNFVLHTVDTGWGYLREFYSSECVEDMSWRPKLTFRATNTTLATAPPYYRRGPLGNGVRRGPNGPSARGGYGE